MAERRVRAGTESVRISYTDTPAERAGALLAAAIRDADRARGHARVAISGGSAIKALPACVSAAGDAWSRVRLTWVDERCVPVANIDSNRGAAHGAVLRAHPVAEVLPLWLDDDTPETALARVRAALVERFDDGLDATLLGMGPDGHIASIFPDRPRPGGDRVTFVDDSPKPPPRRMTMTHAFLAKSPAAVLYAIGASKVPALERLASGDPRLPAYGLPGLTVVTDQDLGDVGRDE